MTGKLERVKHELTPAEAAAYCHRSESTMTRWLRRGRLHARREGHRLFINRDELDQVLRSFER